MLGSLVKYHRDNDLRFQWATVGLPRAEACACFDLSYSFELLTSQVQRMQNDEKLGGEKEADPG